MHRLVSLAAAAIAFAPAAALACGGLFCNNNQPVNQAAERIFFARDGETVHMHVQIAYSGPPRGFGWLLPTPPDVQTTLGTELLFSTLDQSYGPRFQLQRELSDRCVDAQSRFASPTANDGQAEAGGEGGGVQVLSREAVGPYDRVILEAPDVVTLREWLDENEFQIPEATDSVLQPYIDAGAVFVALKLLPGSDSGDVSPLVLSFTSTSPAVPIVPTAVAADPDMGIIVHLLSTERAIPKNYAHVQINEAAIDWLNGGTNYGDVVSQAADEAGGKAFTTDFAGDAGALGAVVPYPEEQLAAIAEAGTLQEVFNALQRFGAVDADAQRVLGEHFEVPDGINPAQFFSCPDCFGDVDWAAPIDGAAVADALKLVNPAREQIVALFADQKYLTRLYTTMSAIEMDEDPIFAFNPDLPEVSATRTATQHIDCDRQGEFVDSYIEVNGLRIAVDLENNTTGGIIMRQDGETVRGKETVGARVIEQLGLAGPAVVVEDRGPALEQKHDAAFSRGGGGCDGCSTGERTPGPGALALFGLLFAIRRRR